MYVCPKLSNVIYPLRAWGWEIHIRTEEEKTAIREKKRDIHIRQGKMWNQNGGVQNTYTCYILMQCESKKRWWVVGLSPTSTRQCMGCICWECFIRHEAHPLINLVEKTKDDRAGTRPIYLTTIRFMRYNAPHKNLPLPLFPLASRH